MLEGNEGVVQRAYVYVYVYSLWLSFESQNICVAYILFDEAKQQYESKVVGTDLSGDPYLIDNWTQDPETIPRLT